MSSINRVELLGNVGADPKITSTRDGGKIANFRIATSESWKDKATGERKERTQWHTVVSFNDGLTGVIEKYVKKGSKVFVAGQLETRKWQDQSGQDRYSTEVILRGFRSELVLLTSKGERGGDSHDDDQRDEQPQAWMPPSNGGGLRDLDDEIPFMMEWR